MQGDEADGGEADGQGKPDPDDQQYQQYVSLVNATAVWLKQNRYDRAYGTASKLAAMLKRFAT